MTEEDIWDMLLERLGVKEEVAGPLPVAPDSNEDDTININVEEDVGVPLNPDVVDIGDDFDDVDVDQLGLYGGEDPTE